MSTKLIAIDTDGTLLNSEKKILATTKEAISRVLHKGIKVVLCTNKPINGIRKYLKELGIKGSAQYVITLDGAIIRNTDDDVINYNLIPNTFYRKFAAFALENKIAFNIVDAKSRIITPDHNINSFIYEQAIASQDPVYVRAADEIPEDVIQIAKACFASEEAKINDIEPLLKKRFKKELNVIRAKPTLLELVHFQVNKGKALEILCKKLGYSKDDIIAIGDERNDISMLDFAGTSICMENGNPEVKEHADYITSSNDQDGISKAINKFIF